MEIYVGPQYKASNTQLLRLDTVTKLNADNVNMLMDNLISVRTRINCQFAELMLPN